ncbi:hypothetical protein AWM68_15740 [Fictibacillus phosphorivorans]|uniref:DUF3813 family protein n=1 Tax=Fictibacillus phosphorivorans TaxID=1221500 RepID=A0A163PFW2_9BACL|nr:DUF3813 domain-containing protein [Fictibacillus phosphorivorans]KZE63463.1 hypothetical protein AWM68_15740 [Fictibacillus phosphorivorans]
MANKLFQIAKNAVQQAVGKVQNSTHELNNNISNHHNPSHTELSGHDMEVAQNALSSAMANSSDAERAQLAEFQKQLDAHSHPGASQNAQSKHFTSGQTEPGHLESGQPQSFSQAAGLSLEDAQSLLEENPDSLK